MHRVIRELRQLFAGWREQRNQVNFYLISLFDLIEDNNQILIREKSVFFFLMTHQHFVAVEAGRMETMVHRDTACINIIAVQLFLSAFVTARFHGIRRGEIKNK